MFAQFSMRTTYETFMSKRRVVTNEISVLRNHDAKFNNAVIKHEGNR